MYLTNFPILYIKEKGFEIVVPKNYIMKRIWILSLVLIFIQPIITFAQDNVKWNTLVFKNYSIDYPTDKRLVKNSPEGNFTLYLLAQQTDNIMMQINDLAGYMLTLDSYAFQFSDAYFRRADVTLLEDKSLTINNQPCHKFVATVDDGHGEIQFKTMVYIWVKNNWAYNLTFTAKPDKYNELMPIAQKVVGSFKYIK